MFQARLTLPHTLSSYSEASVSRSIYVPLLVYSCFLCCLAAPRKLETKKQDAFLNQTARIAVTVLASALLPARIAVTRRSLPFCFSPPPARIAVTRRQRHAARIGVRDMPEGVHV